MTGITMSDEEIEKEVKAIQKASKELRKHTPRQARAFLKRVGAIVEKGGFVKSNARQGPFTRAELLKLHEEAIKEVKAMTPEEGFQSLIEAGIYTPDGKLAPEYGGPPREKVSLCAAR
ncbi:hypothetical protein KGQ27_03690 [Patescibacteria group bacterium]|nr:hypothetical protein [Patescibacteria group bacterium]MDE2011204.1 hypothetical protein [Patescibacteria group bacterium]MDE2233494.1 hypothetical protein [Patescibacteria group bacterium]